MGFIIKIATMVLGGGVVSAISSNLMVIGIAGAALLVTNAISGVVWYVKGHNSAAAQCRVNTLIQERDQLKRDVNIAKQTAVDTTAELETMKEREARRAQQEANNAANIKPIEGCVIDDPLPGPGRLRRNRNRG